MKDVKSLLTASALALVLGFSTSVMAGENKVEAGAKAEKHEHKDGDHKDGDHKDHGKHEGHKDGDHHDHKEGESKNHNDHKDHKNGETSDKRN